MNRELTNAITNDSNTDTIIEEFDKPLGVRPPEWNSGHHRQITSAFSAPFEATEVKFKPQAVKGNRALALAYVDVRVIQDRLDDVLGVENWQDEYEILPDMSVICRLRAKIGETWITKMDVGSPSEQPDGGDRLKAAFSDALKRAAVKFGIGRYLYRLKAEWWDYDPVKKTFTSPPRLPAFALPEKPKALKATRPLSPAVPQPAPPRETIKMPPPAPSPAPTSKPRPAAALPDNGEELHRRLREKDSDLAKQGICQPGKLLTFVTQAGIEAGYDSDMTRWTGPAIELGVHKAKAFLSELNSTAKAVA